MIFNDLVRGEIQRRQISPSDFKSESRARLHCLLRQLIAAL
jgi:hypothetical protein